jgi:purine-binding chemotaxis protein CheW
MGERSLVFRAGAHLCALGLPYVIEVMRPRPVEALASAPPFVAGASVIRGEAVPVVDLAALVDRQGRHGARSGTITRFVTVRGGQTTVALGVDEVLGVREFPVSTRSALAPLLTAADDDVIASIAVLDAQPLLFLRATSLVPAHVWAELETAPAR